VGLAGISVLALGGVDVAGVMSSIGSSSLGAPAKVLFAFPLIYHYGGGMRHFVSSVCVCVFVCVCIALLSFCAGPCVYMCVLVFLLGVCLFVEH
jgi:succinate dehydrogenase/fumarate reductase cytochrome b subunit